MAVIIPQVVSKSTTSGSGAQVIDGSLHITSAAYNSGPHLTRTPGSAGNRRTWTWAGWVKRNKFETGSNQEHALFVTSDSNSNTDYVTLYFNDSGYLRTTGYHSGSTQWSLKTSQIFRDSGWMHIVWAVDLSQSTSSDRVKLYVNGSQITSFSTETYPSSAADTRMNSTNEHSIGRASLYNRWHATIGLSQVYLIDGQQLTPESFGFTDPLTNTWKPKKYTGAFTATIPGKSESDTYADSGRFTSYATFGTVTENDTGYTLPSGSWSHYGGKVKELDTGGFQIVTVNSATTDFFMGCWVKFETYATDRQIGINNFGNYVYWETQSNGAVGVRHNGGSRHDSSGTDLNDGNWHHIALSRTGGTLYGFVDGTAVISTTSGVSGNSVGANSQFWFFGGSGTAYNIDGQVIDPFVYIGQGLSSYTTPTSPLIDSSGSVNSLFGINSSYLYYASPGIDLGLSGGTAPNSFYLPMDGNSPIGKDQSGNGNDFTPVNFGGSVALDNPQVSGARPILNTTQGGAQAAVGVFGSKQNVGYAVTVYDDGGGNKYYIDGVKQDTVTGLIRGATYTFDTSDSTVSSHPFRFSATSNGSHGGGSEYTTGVAAITGAATTITVPHDAPNTLYYYCTSHSGMGADITGITTNEKLADQYASHCVLALPLVGSANDVSASIACTMTNKSVTSNGGAVGLSTESNFYDGSFFFDGSDDFLNIADNTDFTVGSAPFTFEFWAYKTASGEDFFWGSSNSSGSNTSASYAVQTGGGSPSNSLRALVGDGSSTLTVVNSGIDFVLNKWVHIAFVRDGNTLRLFQDGVQVGTTSFSGTVKDSSDPLMIGRGFGGNSSKNFPGYIQDFRFYKGVAKYTSDFVVPSRSPDILPDTPSGVAGGSKLTKITDGAVTFDGTGDYLEIADNADFEMGAGDFTIEAFFYNQENAVQSMITKYGDSASDRSFWLGTLSSTNPSFYWYSGGSSYNIDGGAGTLPLNKWSHVVAQRTSGDIYLFVDGKVVASATGASGAYSFNDISEPVVIGSDSYASNEQPFQGFISNVRIVKGTGVYNTIGFTPPTAPLTNVTNTKLLCCQSNTSATEAAVTPGSITANGDAVATNFNPFNTDINTVRGQETGYATLNLLAVVGGATYSDGNLKVTGSTAYRSTPSTIGMSEGKWYVEYFFDLWVNDSHLGVMNDISPATTGTWAGNTANGFAWAGAGGDLWTSGSQYNASFDETYTTGDTCQIAFDADNGKMYFGKNGIWLKGANPSTGSGAHWTGLTNGPYHPFVTTTNGTICSANFGQKPFKFSPPDGFQPLNAANVRPVKVISRPDQYVGISTWTGDGNDRFIEYGMKPDLFIVKSRNDNYRPGWFDSVRGFKNVLWSSRTAIQNNASSYPEDPTLTGITVNNDDGQTNQNTKTYVGWAFKAGGNKNTFNVDDVGYATAAAAGLDGGDITPTGASVGTKQGFSIIEFTGSASGTPSISHGLSEAPNFIAQKDTGATTSWRVFMYNGTTWGIMNFDDASGVTSASETAPTSSLFYANGNGNAANTQIAYLWHDVPGLQKFGTFEGNGNANGPFIELGFRPSLILMRNLDNYGTNYDWCIYDNERAKFNPNDVFQCINLEKQDNVRGDNTADNSRDVDFLNNGFKIRNTASTLNLNSHTIFYAAWAEAPTIDLFGGGANAR